MIAGPVRLAGKLHSDDRLVFGEGAAGSVFCKTSRCGNLSLRGACARISKNRYLALVVQNCEDWATMCFNREWWFFENLRFADNPDRYPLEEVCRFSEIRSFLGGASFLSKLDFYHGVNKLGSEWRRIVYDFLHNFYEV